MGNPDMTLTYHYRGAPAAMPVVLPAGQFGAMSNYTPPAPPPPSLSLDFNFPEQKPPGGGLAIGTAKAFLKDKLPQSVKNIGTVAKAAMAGEKLANAITREEEIEGSKGAEAYACAAAQVLTEEITGKIMKGYVVGGIPAYLAAAAASPPLAVTVPIVASVIPAAYQAAQIAAHRAGETTHEACHHGFDAARKLLKQEEKK